MALPPEMVERNSDTGRLRGHETPAAPAPAAAVPATPVAGVPGAEAEFTSDNAAHVDAANRMMEVPSDPAEYRLPPLAREHIPEATDLTSLRAAAVAVGLTTGEFRTIASSLAGYGINPGALPTDPAIHKMRANAMGRELDGRHGPERATEIVQGALNVIATIREHSPAYAAALRAAIVVNRPLLERLGSIGERNARKRK